MAKYTFRLDEENPLHKEALQKIQNSGDKVQQYLLRAVLAYNDNPLQGLPMADIDKIATRLVWHIDQLGGFIKAPAQEAAAIDDILEEQEPEEPGTDDEPSVDADIMSFIDGL